MRAVIALCLMASPIHAQATQCAERAGVVEALKIKYGEVQIMLGRQGPDSVLEVFANRKTGSWTVLTTNMAGLSCLRSAGTDLVVAKPGEPA